MKRVVWMVELLIMLCRAFGVVRGSGVGYSRRTRMRRVRL